MVIFNSYVYVSHYQRVDSSLYQLSMVMTGGWLIIVIPTLWLLREISHIPIKHHQSKLPPAGARLNQTDLHPIDIRLSGPNKKET